MNTRSPDRLERLERGLLGAALVAGVVWAVAGSQAAGLLASLTH